MAAEPKIVGKAASCQMSGHVSYSAQQLAFYGMVDRRVNKQSAMRKAGILAQKPSRNPMKAEKTPRNPEYGHFDYSIPTGRKDLGKECYDRWHYPEVDHGLMGKFSSQTEKYRASDAKLEDYRAKMEADQNEKYEAAAERTFRNTHRETARQESYRDEPTPISARENLEGNLSSQSITNFRILAKENPEVLDKWRAERAAEFLAKTKSPLDPPPRRTVKHNKAMLPAGTFHEEIPDYGDNKYAPPKPHPKVRGPLVPHGKNQSRDIAAMKATLTDLLGSLDQNEKELKRQELAVSLNARRKASYEAPRTGRSTARSGSGADLRRSP